MINLKEIFTAWAIARKPTLKQIELAKKRLEICNECPSMVESVVFTYKCKECGCPIGKKIFTPNLGTCDLKKWDKVE